MWLTHHGIANLACMQKRTIYVWLGMKIMPIKTANPWMQIIFLWTQYFPQHSITMWTFIEGYPLVIKHGNGTPPINRWCSHPNKKTINMFNCDGWLPKGKHFLQNLPPPLPIHLTTNVAGCGCVQQIYTSPRSFPPQFSTFTNTSHHVLWLLVSTPLKNMKVSWDHDIPNIWKVIKFMFQTPTSPMFFSFCLRACDSHTHIDRHTSLELRPPMLSWSFRPRDMEGGCHADAQISGKSWEKQWETVKIT